MVFFFQPGGGTKPVMILIESKWETPETSSHKFAMVLGPLICIQKKQWGCILSILWMKESKFRKAMEFTYSLIKKTEGQMFRAVGILFLEEADKLLGVLQRGFCMSRQDSTETLSTCCGPDLWLLSPMVAEAQHKERVRVSEIFWKSRWAEQPDFCPKYITRCFSLQLYFIQQHTARECVSWGVNPNSV